tara:strand:- start:150 stop:1616 length:1467 start_codon:yes stop_codon:yes gene_type:complete
LLDCEENLFCKTKVIPVIISGGIGSRLWPLSRPSYPKQYLNLDNNKNNYTLLQNTYLRLLGLKNLEPPLIICNEEHRFIAAEQMRIININPKSIILEPFGRNTAPAIALAALSLEKVEDDPILLILPADHKIVDINEFKNTIEEGLKFAENGRLVTFGVTPTSPETGYGYIESEDEISNKNKSSSIKRFIEKPNKAVAEKLIEKNNYTWNSGIFLFKSSTIIEELNKYDSRIIDICKKSLHESNKDLNFQRINKKIFQDCPKISIDNAVMEKTKVGTVLKLNAGWNDLGNWKSLWEEKDNKPNNNFLIGKTHIKDVKNTFIRSEGRLVVGLGLENLFIVETEDSVLVANKDCINSIKDLVKELEKRNFEEINENKKTHRPWGFFINILKEKNWQVKRLEINPNESISLQKHCFRSEHWVVVKGEAKVEINDEISFLKKDESIYVPCGSKHRVSNSGLNSLTIIEVQSGSYLGEDDIIRFEDKYKRGNN